MNSTGEYKVKDLLIFRLGICIVNSLPLRNVHLRRFKDSIESV